MGGDRNRAGRGNRLLCKINEKILLKNILKIVADNRYIIDYYSAMNKHKILSFVVALSELNDSLLSEISQTQKEKSVAHIEKSEEVRL